MKPNNTEIVVDAERRSAAAARRNKAKAPSPKPVLVGSPGVVHRSNGEMCVDYSWSGGRACVDARRHVPLDIPGGFAPYGPLPSSDVWEIVRVVTHQRGIGTGTLVMTEAMRQFVAMGAQAVVLAADPYTPGNRKRLWAFFERFGFRAAIPRVPKSRTGMIWTPPTPVTP